MKNVLIKHYSPSNYLNTITDKSSMQENQYYFILNMLLCGLIFSWNQSTQNFFLPSIYNTTVPKMVLQKNVLFWFFFLLSRLFRKFELNVQTVKIKKKNIYIYIYIYIYLDKFHTRHSSVASRSRFLSSFRP